MLVREAGFSKNSDKLEKLITVRDCVRQDALAHSRSVCSSSLAVRCRSDRWRGGGERELLLDLAERRVSGLEFGVQLNVEDEIAQLEALLDAKKKIALEAQRTDLEAQLAKLNHSQYWVRR